MRRRKTNPGIVPLALVVTVVVVGAIVALAQNNSKKAPIGAGVQAAETTRVSTAASDPSEATRKPLSYYTGGVRPDLFTAPLPPAPKPKVETKPAPPPAPPVIVNPFADYAYSGTVGMGDRLMALVENIKTKEGQYLQEGDPFMGGKVARITDRLLTIDVAGKQQMLAKSDDFKLTPLDKSAAFLQPNAQTAGPGQPGQAPAAAPAMGPGGGFPGMDKLPDNIRQRIQERMGNMSPEDRAKMQERWMNRSFERGGNGGGGRGRGRGGNGGYGGG